MGRGRRGAGVNDLTDPAGFSAQIDVTWISAQRPGKKSCDAPYACFCTLVVTYRLHPIQRGNFMILGRISRLSDNGNVVGHPESCD